jgi:hypothetical protein
MNYHSTRATQWGLIREPRCSARCVRTVAISTVLASLAGEHKRSRQIKSFSGPKIGVR